MSSISSFNSDGMFFSNVFSFFFPIHSTPFFVFPGFYPLLLCQLTLFFFLVPKPTRKPVNSVKPNTGAKPFIASSVTPVPTMPPPLVLPSEIRRNSLATGGRSRSSSSSPAPTNSNTSTNPSSLHNHQPVPPSQNPYNNGSSANSAFRPAIPSTYSEYTGRPISTIINDSQSRSKSMTTASLGERAKLQTKPQGQPQVQQPVVQQKPEKISFGQKLKKAFSFGKKTSTEPKPKSERTFSLSFAKKSRSSTMNASVTPLHTGKKSGRSMTLSNMSSSNRTSTMTSTVAPTFEGFDSVFVDTHKKKSSRSRSHIDDDAMSLKSNASISSFATLKKMSKNLFNKNGIPSSSSHQFVAADNGLLDSIPKSTSVNSVPSIARTKVQSSSTQRLSSAPSSPVVVKAERPRSFSMGAVVAEDVTPSFSAQPPTPTRTDVESIVTDAASTIKVSTTSPDETPAAADEESDEDLNIADTVFPKNLDSETVETIRTSLDRTKSLERRRSRRSNRSNPSINSVENRSTQLDALDVQLVPQNAPVNNPSNSTTSPHSILKPSTTSSIPETEEEIPVIATRNRISLKPSPSISSIFDFGDSDFNLDLNFDFAPAAAAGLETEVKKYKSSLKSKPKDYSFTETKASDSKRGNKFYHPMYQPQSPEHSSQRSSSSNSNHTHTGVTFSPRIIIYETYDPLEYDRHAEPATCNRITPLLAQQIKEELNTLKMEMEVHADSRIYTHFY